MKNIDELLGVAKLSELMSNDKKDESKKVLWVLAIIGAVAAVAGIAAVVYKYLSPDYLEDIDDDYDDEEDDDEEEDDYEPEPRCRPVREQAERRTSSAPAKRRWKIILEDIDSWEKYSFTFCDSVGIGRGKDGSMYERYLPLTSDGRISKLHCVIIHKNDKLYVKDEDSRNGTYLNGVRIDRPMEIQRDDIIGVGETRLEVQRILRESD